MLNLNTTNTNSTPTSFKSIRFWFAVSQMIGGFVYLASVIL